VFDCWLPALMLDPAPLDPSRPPVARQLVGRNMTSTTAALALIVAGILIALAMTIWFLTHVYDRGGPPVCQPEVRHQQ
jgi:hypothetical protein